MFVEAGVEWGCRFSVVVAEALSPAAAIPLVAAWLLLPALKLLLAAGVSDAVCVARIANEGGYVWRGEGVSTILPSESST